MTPTTTSTTTTMRWPTCFPLLRRLWLARHTHSAGQLRVIANFNSAPNCSIMRENTLSCNQKDTEDEVIELIEDSPYRAKVEQLRAWAPFVGTLMTVSRHKMTEDNWIIACYTESRLTRLETILNEAKIKCDRLYRHTESSTTGFALAHVVRS
ncbi:uncharacterized protein LOC133848590 [Drosophila sulfurigaster albostrigata]|uniref:uncharacterized protein LOC133848590 n=1 Tax=Drosophila sulfurigaster albostrigata TaxID=89887 RepID=UPI002D21D462|nr:uncharacterized protein LOC133848590 [Drosophila sulfurigaster albostrigata]